MLNYLFGAVIFVLDIWAIANIINSPSETLTKVLWIIGVLAFPVLGFLAWYFAGPKPAA